MAVSPYVAAESAIFAFEKATLVRARDNDEYNIIINRKKKTEQNVFRNQKKLRGGGGPGSRISYSRDEGPPSVRVAFLHFVGRSPVSHTRAYAGTDEWRWNPRLRIRTARATFDKKAPLKIHAANAAAVLKII